ncbi:MAG: potassium channel family protein [Acidobacteriota bacterium]
MVGQHTWGILSYAALVVIVICLLPVILMTYAIMWTPAHDPSKYDSKLCAADIADWNNFCKTLKDINSGSMKDSSPFGVYRERIVARLPENVHALLESGRLSKQVLVAELNNILRVPDLHLAINLDNGDIPQAARELLLQRQKNFRDGEVQKLHRILLDVCFSGMINPLPDGAGSKSRDNWWEEFLLSLKEGVTKAHFSVLATFFAVFLGITYLFGFAFAFHDQNSIEKGENPDLYMPNTLQNSAGAQQLENNGVHPSSQLALRNVPPLPNEQVQSTTGVPQFDTASQTTATQPTFDTARYAFYFNTISAIPDINPYSSLDERFEPGNTSKDPGNDWRAVINHKRIERLQADILRFTERGEKLRVELVGSTDECAPQDSPFLSNYELSEARSENIKYILLRRLSEKEKRERDIEWVTLPTSSEGSPLLFPSVANAQQVDCTRAGQRRPAEGRKTANALTTVNLEDLKRTLLMDKLFLREDVDFLNKKVEELKTATLSFHLGDDQMKIPLLRIESLATAISDRNKEGNEDKKKEFEKDVRRQDVEFAESLDVFRYVDDRAARRVVVVSLTPIRKGQWFIPLSLMDYMYFSIYTITTTGYGDITPTSTFAKFLCSSANILEVFFLVVFFSALLSVKREKRFSRARDRN